MHIRSVLAGGEKRGDQLAAELLPDLLSRFPRKFYWFATNGYVPHVYQSVFHGATNRESEHLAKFRHLVAGRRGGKTLSAAWEVLFYAIHPEEFHRDVHGRESDRPLWIWLLTKDYPTGFPSLQTLRDVMRQAGLVKGKDFQENKTERRIEFIHSGSVIQFKTADDPQSLRGAGLDILWMDEAAFIPTAEAWLVVYPALTDREGLVITTTTPHGKNWLYEEFFQGDALTSPDEFRVEYTSLDNPYFSRAQWERAKRRYHPIFFKQEFMASFDAFHGVALQGDWLKYYVTGNPDVKTGDVTVKHLLTEDGRYKLRVFLGVDPAISLSDSADQFAMAAVGVTDDNLQVFLLDTFLGRLPFPDQIDLIREWHLKWRPDLIGVEANAYQQALAQQAARLDTFPGIVPTFAKGKKNDRILTMSPLFKIGKVRISRTHSDFIDQWLSFDPEKKNQKDDLLDAVEIALSTAGILLPMQPHESLISDIPRAMTPGQAAKAQIRSMREDANRPYDPDMGTEW